MQIAEYVSAIPEIAFPPNGRLDPLGWPAFGSDRTASAGRRTGDGQGSRQRRWSAKSSDSRTTACSCSPSTRHPSSRPEPRRAGAHQVQGRPVAAGRVLDGLGRPLDGMPMPSRGGEEIELDPPSVDPMARGLTSLPLDVGVRAVNGLLTLGVGQKIGVFSMPGVGKSMLLGMMARGTSADTNVIALIGERGREAREFIEDILGPQGLARSVVVVVTSDKPAPMRLKGAFLATAIAAHLRRQGRSVLLLMDSLTRVAMAQREIGLASGEPPTARGYPPSVFAIIPRLVEQAGAVADSRLRHRNLHGPAARGERPGRRAREIGARRPYHSQPRACGPRPLPGDRRAELGLARRPSGQQRRAYPQPHAFRRMLRALARRRGTDRARHLQSRRRPSRRRSRGVHGKLDAFLKQGVEEQVPLAQSIEQLAEAIQ